MKTKNLTVLGVLLLFCAGVRAQEKVTVDRIAPVSVRMGQSAPLLIKLHVHPGFHINSNKPTTPELIPTQVSFTPPEDLAVAKVKYPPGELKSFPFDPSTKLSVYSGDVAVHAVVLPMPKAGIGTYTVHAELKYQACDNNACYPPKRVPIAFDVRIGGSGRRSPHLH